MDLQLLVTFINYTNELESITISTNKNELVSNSKYFESLFSEKFHEHNENIIKIDLTTNENCYDGKMIQHFFEINCLEHKLPTQNQTILNEFNKDCSNPIIQSSIISLNFCFDVDFSEIMEMLQLADYFVFDKFKQYLIDCVIVFPTFFKNLLQCKQTNYTFSEKYILEFDKIQKIDNTQLGDAISLYKQKFVLEQFIKNIYVFFTFYKNIDKIDIFKNIVTIVDKIIDNPKIPKIPYFKNIDSFEKLNITDEELKQIPLDILFQLLNYAPKIISTNKTVFKLYDFYDILNYEPSNFETFGYICNENCKETFCSENCVNYCDDDCEMAEEETECTKDRYEMDEESEGEDEEENGEEEEPEIYKPKIGDSKTSNKYKKEIEDCKPKIDKSKKEIEDCKPKIDNPIINKNKTPITYNIKSINSHEKFMNLFHTKTNNVFVNFDWNNVILAGGFLYGLVDNICNSILPGSDVDLFVFGEPEIIENKTKQLLEYFSQFNPYYVCNGNVITLIIPSLNYDIQIISFANNINELNIITNFDYNYVKLYFDGTNIFCTLDNLLALKYKIAILTPNENQKEYMITSRIYKTTIKGLKIKYDSQIKNPCIDGNNIKMNTLHDNQQIKTNLTKSVSIRKLMPHLESHEITELIKSYYKTQNVFMNIEQINNTSTNMGNSDYDFLKNKNKNVNINNINDIKVVKKYSNLSYYSFHTINNETYNNISIQTTFCIFKKRIHDGRISLVLYVKDNETKQKLINLHNCLNKIIEKKNLHREKMRKMFICGYNDNSYKIIKTTDDDLKLVVHVINNMKNYDKIIEQINNLNGNDLVQVLCSGSFWFSKTNGSCGIKFYADNVRINKQYNILK